MYKDKIKQVEEELNKVKGLVLEYQALEQRLVGRLYTLQELQAEDDALGNPPVAADSESDEK